MKPSSAEICTMRAIILVAGILIIAFFLVLAFLTAVSAVEMASLFVKYQSVIVVIINTRMIPNLFFSSVSSNLISCIRDI